MKFTKPQVIGSIAPAAPSMPKLGATPGVGPRPMPAPAMAAPKPPKAVAKPKKPFMAEKLGKSKEPTHPSSHAEFMKLGA